MKNYLLMHKDKPLAIFSLENNNIIGYRQNPTGTNYLPFLGENKNITDWIKNRGVPVTRQGLKRAISVTSPFELALDNLGLSLTDCYWFKPVDSKLSWVTVNLFSNDFRDTFSLDLTKTVNKSNSIANKTNFLPSASLKGDLRKKWLIDKNGTRILVKGNYSESCIQSLSESLATEIHKLQNVVEYTPYSLITISSEGRNVIGCSCPNFCTEQLEFVPAIDIVNIGKKPNHMNW